jgi:queuine tRNA-ribosyltransferase
VIADKIRRFFPKAVLHHLLRTYESQLWQLLALHNIHFYMKFMERMRREIIAGSFLEFYRSQVELVDQRDSSATEKSLAIV